MQKSKMAVGRVLTNSSEKKGSEKQRETERHSRLNAEFQGIARRDKKAFLSDQYLLNGKDPDAGRDWG